jgi:putative intracellular protease/amidase
MSKRVLLVVTSHSELGTTGRKTGYFLSEVTHPYKVLKEAGCRITVASPRGGKAPVDERSLDMSDGVNSWFMDSPEERERLDNTVPLAEVLARDVDAVVFAGGHGTMWDFPDNRDVLRLIQTVWENDGIVAAVCHGPAALVNAKDKSGRYLVDGRNVTAFTNSEETTVELDKVVPFLLQTKLEERGATFKSAAQWLPNVIVSDRLITGQNPASAKGVGEAVAAMLNS